MAITFSADAADPGAGGGSRAIYHVTISGGTEVDNAEASIAHGLGGVPGVVIRQVALIPGGVSTLQATSVGACYVSFDTCGLSAPGLSVINTYEVEMNFHSSIYPPQP